MPLKNSAIRRAAMDLLARREHGYQELMHKLLRRFSRSGAIVDPANGSLQDMVIRTLDKLKSETLLSDDRLAEVFIRARANRGQGPVKIRAELQGKGLDEPTIKFAFETCGIDWFSLIKDVSRRRFGELQLDAKARAKRNRFLQGRGFSFDDINGIDSRCQDDNHGQAFSPYQL